MFKRFAVVLLAFGLSGCVTDSLNPFSSSSALTYNEAVLMFGQPTQSTDNGSGKTAVFVWRGPQSSDQYTLSFDGSGKCTGYSVSPGTAAASPAAAKADASGQPPGMHSPPTIGKRCS
jgi:hypothetical protein